MILRKPYGFLIKHFKLIHLIITGILCLIVIQNRRIYSFLNQVILDVVHKYDAFNYINYGIFILIFLVCGLFLIVYWLLKYKDKPRKIYLFSIIGYLIIGIILFITFIYMQGFGNNVIDQKTIRLYKDILFITQLFQFYIIIFMFIRGLGFDIKRFNFNKDAQELNLTDSDGEEVEVNVLIDTTNVMRGVRKRSREFGYFFNEFKIYIIIIIVIILVFLGIKGYGYYNQNYKVYHEGDVFGRINNIIIRDSYYSVGKNEDYVIVNVDIMRNFKADRLNMANVMLVVGNKKYTPDKNICYKFNSLGNCYKKQYINSNYTSYIFVYKVDTFNLKRTYFLYNESYEDTYKVKLDLENWEE